MGHRWPEVVLSSAFRKGAFIALSTVCHLTAANGERSGMFGLDCDQRECLYRRPHTAGPVTDIVAVCCLSRPGRFRRTKSMTQLTAGLVFRSLTRSLPLVEPRPAAALLCSISIKTIHIDTTPLHLSHPQLPRLVPTDSIVSKHSHFESTGEETRNTH
jgi:hypothetical protein